MYIKEKQLRHIVFLFVFFAALVSAYWRFHSWMPQIFYADDLATIVAFYSGHFANTISQCFLESYVEKYRPIFALFCHAFFSSFGKTIWPYLAVNLFIHGINALLFFIIAAKLSKNNFFIPFILMLIFATSRLALFQLTLVIGTVESIALSFFLMMLCALYQAGNSRHSLSWSWLALLFLSLAIYTHERYIIVLPWLAFTLFFIPRMKSLTLYSRWFLVIGCVSVGVLNVLIKTVFFRGHFLVGTGGAYIGIDLCAIIHQLSEAVLSVFGFNFGPSYLVGRNIEFCSWLCFFSLVYSCIWLGLVVSALVRTKKTRCYFFALFSLAILILIPPIFTIRMEARWEYTPFILLLLCLAWSYSTVKDCRKATIACFIFLACIAISVIDYAISKHFTDIYFIGGWRSQGNTINQDILLPKRTIPGEPIVVRGTPDVCAILLPEIFQVYEGKTRTIYCVALNVPMQQIKKKYPGMVIFSFLNNRFMIQDF